jgi:flagellar basal-body rod modification protein FlgD
MTTTSTVWNHGVTTEHSQRSIAPLDSAGGDATSSTSEASISANDFLTLLVTELKNQDPTANTDPNAYVNQLVQVNSLEQLISINQTLQDDAAGTVTSQAVNRTGAAVISGNSAVPGPQANLAAKAPGNVGTQDSLRSAVPGNLSIPRPSPSAQRVAQSLGGIPVHY